MKLLGIPFAGLVVFSTLLFGSLRAYSPQECKDLGFDAEVVRCAHCPLLLQFTEPSLYDECKGCCVESTVGDDNAGGAAEVVAYKKGRLELDFRGIYPGSEISRFLKEHADRFDNLQVVDIPRTMPRVIFYGDDGHMAETIRVHSWRCDLIVELLQKRLAKTA